MGFISELPLCAKYTCLGVTSLHLAVSEPDATGPTHIRLALGVTSHGEVESAGLFDAAITAGRAESIFGDCRDRGIEDVDIILAESEMDTAAALRVYPGAKVALPRRRITRLALLAGPEFQVALDDGLLRLWRASSIANAKDVLTRLEVTTWQSLPMAGELGRAAIEQWLPIYAMRRRQRSRVLRCETKTGELLNGLVCELCRRRPFASASAGAAFAQEWIDHSVVHSDRSNRRIRRRFDASSLADETSVTAH